MYITYSPCAFFLLSKKTEVTYERITGAIFFDLTQVYDRVSKDYLIVKLHRIGVGQNLLRWIVAFLAERRIQVKIGNSFSGERILA